MDFAKRSTILRDIRKRSASEIRELIQELLANKEDGRVKLFLIYMALKARMLNLGLFQKGASLKRRGRSGILEGSIIRREMAYPSERA